MHYMRMYVTIALKKYLFLPISARFGALCTLFWYISTTTQIDALKTAVFVYFECV